MTVVRWISWACVLTIATQGCAKNDGDNKASDAGSDMTTTGGTSDSKSDKGGMTGSKMATTGGVSDSASDDGGVTGGAMATTMLTPSGGMIRDGVCYPPEAPTRMELGAQVEVLVKKSGDLSSLMADETGVYYANRGDGVYRIAPETSTSELLLATPDQSQSYGLRGISGDYFNYTISDAYAAGPRLLQRLPLSDFSATPEVIIDDAHMPFAVDAMYFYAIDPTTGDLYRQSIPGGDAEVLYSGLGADFLRYGGDGYLYYGRNSGDPSVWRMPIDGGTPEHVINVIGGNFRSLELASGGLVWMAYMYGLYFTPFGEPTTAQRLHPENMINLLGVKDDRVYWSVDDLSQPVVGWTKLDNSDCDALIDPGSEFDWAVIGTDGIYIRTFGTTDPPDHIYRIPLL